MTWRDVAGRITTPDLIRAAPRLYRRMLEGWAVGGRGYREHQPDQVCWQFDPRQAIRESEAGRALATVRFDGERWEDLLIEGTAPAVDDALWDAASLGVSAEELVDAIRSTWRPLQ